MRLKKFIVIFAVFLSFFTAVVFTNAANKQPDIDVVNLQRAVIEMKKLIDSHDARIIELEKRVNALEKSTEIK